MRLLFELDRKDHGDCTQTYVRDSARSIVIQNGKIAMIHSLKYDYYKFPGGGIEKGETPVEAMIRETREEAGLVVKPETVREFGYVHRVQKSDTHPEERFVQDNYYFICQVEEKSVEQCLDQYEAQEHFVLEWVDPQDAILKNKGENEDYHNSLMCKREVRVLEMLLEEGDIYASGFELRTIGK